MARDGVVDLHLAFSRIPGEKKIYVQDRLLEQQDAVWRAIDAGGVIYVCGDATRMAPDVRRAFAAIHAAKTGGTEAAANRWLDDLVTANRYLVDVWAAS
jgi:cytochrome P450/NADPH-cytochrome P450 reductase